MKVLEINKPEVFFVKIDEEGSSRWYMRIVVPDKYIFWRYLDSYEVYLAPGHQVSLEEAYKNAVEERFNGCN